MPLSVPEGSAIFLITWFTVLFAVLPFGAARGMKPAISPLGRVRARRSRRGLSARLYEQL